MAKNQTTNETEDRSRQSRQSRKDILRARKQEEQLRNIRIAAMIVGIILLLVLGIAVVNEFVLTPNKSVATVSGQGIPLKVWQERVEYERAQRIMALESQLENFNGDVGLIQQFSGQTIVELISENAESMGEAVLDRVVDEEIMRQEAEQRELLPDGSDIEEYIGTTFNYYGGDSPTPLPDPTETVAPTPSLTPIPADGESGLVTEVEPIPGPTNPPLPTPTPVSAESFQQEFDDLLAEYGDLGVSEQTYRSVVASSLIAERLVDTLAKEQTLPDEDMHASMYFLAFSDEAEAQQALDEIQAGDFLTVWNEVRSRPADAAADNSNISSASEVLWRSRESLAGSFGEETAEEAFILPIGVPSNILVVSGANGEPLNVIIMVSGREMRELAANEYESRKQQLLFALLEERRAEDVEKSEIWRGRVPTSPVLDPKFRQPPTPAPDSDLTTGIEGVESQTPAP